MKRPFRVGDRVRYTGRGLVCGYPQFIGRTGKIIAVFIAIDYCDLIWDIDGGRCLGVRNTNLELCNVLTPLERQIQDYIDQELQDGLRL